MIKNHKKLLIIVFILLIITVVLLVVIDKYLTKPVTASVVNSPYKTTEQTTLNLIPKSYSDSHISFNYPSIMSIDPTPKFASPIVDVVNLSYPDSESWLLSVQIVNIPSGKLSDNSSYNVRIINPTKYQLTEANINGVSIPIFTDETSLTYSKVAFITSGEFQASVALSGDDLSGQTPLSNTMAMILNSWQWQNGY